MYHWFMAYGDPPLAWIPGNTWPSLFLGQLRPLLVACLRPAHIDAQGTTWRFPEMRVQWNNCLRTYCNKSFRGWVAGFNPFCQLVEIKTLSRKSSHGFLFPLHGYQYTKYGSWAAISKRQIMYRGSSTPMTNMVRPQGEVDLYVVTKAYVNSFSQRPAGVTEGYLTSEAALGLFWLVLVCLCCPVSGAHIKHKLSGPESFFLPPASFAT